MKVNDRYMNEVAQGLRTFDRSVEVFEAQSASRRLTILRLLAFMCAEARADTCDARDAIAQAQLGRKFHPLWRPGRLTQAFGTRFPTTKRGALILSDQDRVEFTCQFKFLMRLFMIADEHRRHYCGEECHHWWHHLR
jgi:hypothetical protein